MFKQILAFSLVSSYPLVAAAQIPADDWMPATADVVVDPGASPEAIVAVRRAFPGPSGNNDPITFTLRRAGEGWRVDAEHAQLVSLPPLRITLQAAGVQLFESVATTEERRAAKDATLSPSTRALTILSVLRRSLPPGEPAIQVALRGLEALRAFKINARLVVGHLEALGSRVFLEVPSRPSSGASLFDPTTASLISLDGKSTDASTLQTALRDGQRHAIATSQIGGLPRRFRADRLGIFPPLWLRSSILGRLHDDGVVEIDMLPLRYRVRHADIEATLIVAGADIFVQATTEGGNGSTEIRLQGARWRPMGGSAGLAKLGLSPVARYDMEPPRDKWVPLAPGVAEIKGSQHQNRSVDPGFENYYQRIESTSGGIAIELPTARYDRYLLGGYLRVHRGSPHLRVVRSRSSAGPAMPPLMAGGWATFVIGPFEGTNLPARFEVLSSSPAAYDLDTLTLYRLPRPICRVTTTLDCTMDLPLAHDPVSVQ